VPRSAKSRMRRTETPKPSWIKFCMVVNIPDIFTYTNFGDWLLVKGFLGGGGQFSPLLLTFIVALTTLSQYHASVWYSKSKRAFLPTSSAHCSSSTRQNLFKFLGSLERLCVCRTHLNRKSDDRVPSNSRLNFKPPYLPQMGADYPPYRNRFSQGCQIYKTHGSGGRCGPPKGVKPPMFPTISWKSSYQILCILNSMTMIGVCFSKQLLKHRARPDLYRFSWQYL